MVAEMMAATMPLPKWIPSCGKSHAPISAPTIPMAMSAIRP